MRCPPLLSFAHLLRPLARHAQSRLLGFDTIGQRLLLDAPMFSIEVVVAAVEPDARGRQIAGRMQHVEQCDVVADRNERGIRLLDQLVEFCP